jgi:hypothetical protein
MTNAASIIRALLIYGLCLPLAIFLGYVLAMPLDRVNLFFVAVVVLLPLIPLLLRWHHVMLVLSWNMMMVLFFLPGSPYVWIVMVAVSLGLTALQHILKRNVQFASVPSVTLPLLFLAAVILITAKLTGGIGLRSFGGEANGGRRYIILLASIAGYFAITSHRTPPGRATLYTALYFLGALSMVITSAAPWMPRGLHALYALFPVENVNGFMTGELGESALRLGGITTAAIGTLCFLLARHGIKELVALGERWHFLPLKFTGRLGFNQPWRILLFLGIVWISLMGGYRGTAITLIMTLFFLFCIEGLFRTRLMPALALVGILCAAVALPLVDKLPKTIQRSLSFLPINVDPAVKLDTEFSSEWRLKIWREVVPTIPQYLLLGKGYAIDARELEAAQAFQEYGRGSSAETTMLASDFHNGPLSLIIPLGIFGVLGFLWFLIASFRVLLHNFRHGLPEHRQLNGFFLAFFLAKVVFFLLVYGSFQTDLPVFTGLVALCVTINGGLCQPAKAPAPNPAYIPFRLPKAARA